MPINKPLTISKGQFTQSSLRTILAPQIDVGEQLVKQVRVACFQKKIEHEQVAQGHFEWYPNCLFLSTL